jgi:hypothetical protein
VRVCRNRECPQWVESRHKLFSDVGASHLGDNEGDRSQHKDAKFNPEQHRKGICGLFTGWMPKRQSEVCEDEQSGPTNAKGQTSRTASLHRGGLNQQSNVCNGWKADIGVKGDSSLFGWLRIGLRSVS